jgi:hypothetical protein
MREQYRFRVLKGGKSNVSLRMVEIIQTNQFNG